MSSFSPDIIVLGSLNVDLVKLIYVSRMPMPGETMDGNSFKINYGGKGANQATMATFMGSKVSMIGKVGNDFFGSTYIKTLKDYGTNIDCVHTSDNSTGVATIMVSEKGENSIIITPGANSDVDPDFVRSVLPPMLKTAKIILLQLEINSDATLTALKLARQAGVMTFLNCTPARKELSYDFFENTDILCCNEIEAEFYSGIKLDLSDFDSIKSVSHKLLSYGAGSVLLTLGSHGAAYFSKRDSSGTMVPVSEVPKCVCDTTGAGDAFIGAFSHFAARMLHKNPNSDVLCRTIIEKCVRIASMTVTKPGTHDSYPKCHELPPELRQ